ncbi:MAG: hypothetical protein R6X02_27900 [Enhygromyxa sp.]
MSESDDGWKYALAALAAIGLGATAYGALGSEGRRRAFKDALGQALQANQIGFIDANLARIEGAPVWQVTVNHPVHGIMMYRVAFPRETDPYSEVTLNAMIQRLLVAIQPVRSWG